MNNWGYAASLPYYGDFAGQDSMIREVKLQTNNGSPTLVSIPLVMYQGIFAPPNSVGENTITTDLASASLPSNLTEGAYVIKATTSKNDGDNGNVVRFCIKSDGSFSTTVGYVFTHSQAFLARDSDGSCDSFYAVRSETAVRCCAHGTESARKEHSRAGDICRLEFGGDVRK